MMAETRSWPATDVEWCEYWCEYWRALDKLHGTWDWSPLHHDQRCVYHRKEKGGRQ